MHTLPESGLTLERLEIERMKLKTALLAPLTRVGYEYDWAHFRAWCERWNREPLPAAEDTVSLYATDWLARGGKVSSIRRRIEAIRHKHLAAGFRSPITEEIRLLLTGARRVRHEPPRQVEPLTIAQLREISAMLKQNGAPHLMRNRAILVVGFASALRSWNLAALRTDDIEVRPEGLVVRVRQEKQDQTGKGRYIGLPRGQHPESCPVRAFEEWMEKRGKDAGALFHRFGHTGGPTVHLVPERISLIVKKCVARIGIDPSRYGSHSLRAGFITAAGEAGIGELLIAAQTGHRDMQVLRRYFRRTHLFRANACHALDL